MAIVSLRLALRPFDRDLLLGDAGRHAATDLRAALLLEEVTVQAFPRDESARGRRRHRAPHDFLQGQSP